jgi:2'-5' RNA ligase
VSATVRLFVAVPCGEQLAEALTTALDGQPAGRFLRWTPSDTWHLTLQFLGDWPRSQVADLAEALNAASAAEVFTLRTEGLGAFPDLRWPRVLFLQLENDGNAAGLAARVRAIVAEIWPDGPQDSRDFRPHLTLSRVRRSLEQEDLKMLKNMELGELPDFPVEGFTLFESRMGSGGARHVPVAEYPLRKKGEKKGLHPS